MVFASGIITMVLDQLGPILVEELKQSTRLVVGADGAVENLARTFKLILAVLADAEEQQLHDNLTELWIGQLRVKSYQIEDLLDEWSTAILRRRIEGSDVQLSLLQRWLLDVSIFFSDVCPYLPTSCFSFRDIPMRHDIARRIKGLNSQLDRLAEETKRYREIGSSSSSSSSSAEVVSRRKKLVASRITTHVLDTTVKGRDLEKQELLKFLVGDTSDEVPNLKIATIVGMGGFGKTTLAQLLLKEMEGGFAKRIWVYVSDSFNETEVAKTILQSLSGKTPESDNLSMVLREVEEQVREKKFFLVLDDVWGDSVDRWGSIMGSLSTGVSGSRILVTTRIVNVADSLSRCIAKLLGGNSNSSHTLKLEELSTEACKEVFGEYAFFKWSDRERRRVEDIAESIVIGKCRGSPLAARILGSFLCSKRSREEWSNVLNSAVWSVEKLRTDLFAHMWFSYYDLSPQLRQCFTYCCIFPKGSVIRKDTLIKLWMAQGYLGVATSQEDLEWIGDDHFASLTARCMLQDVKNDGEERDCGVTFKIHDLVHDFAVFVSGGEISTIDGSGKIDSSGKVMYHLQKTDSGKHDLHRAVGHLKSLRTVIATVYLGPPSMLLKDLILNLPKCLRSLTLAKCEIVELPSVISRLIQLRLLDLSGNKHLELPDELGELLNLQSLVLLHCFSLRKWPKGMDKLVNLRHFINDYAGDSEPKGIGKLTRLRTLSRLMLGKSATLRDLQYLNQLCGSLRIWGLGGSSEQEAKEAQLEKKQDITKLKLEFVYRTRGSLVHDDAILEALKPSENLQELGVSDYQGKVLPSWISLLNNLTKLTLSRCRECSHLHPLAKLPCLEYLDLTGFYEVKKAGGEFFGICEEEDAFPSLTELRISHFFDMEEWEWCGVQKGMTRNASQHGNNHMPCLGTLYLEGFDKLQKLPDQLIEKTTLEKLEVKHCYGLYRMYGAPDGKERGKVAHIRSVTFENYTCDCGKAIPDGGYCDCPEYDYRKYGWFD